MCTVISTEAVPPGERIAYWHEKMLEAFCADVQVAPRAHAPLRAVARVHALGPLLLMDLQGEGFDARCRVLEGGSEVVVLVPVAGAGTVRQCGQEIALDAGHFCVMPGAIEAQLVFPQAFRVIALGLRRQRLPAIHRRGGGLAPIGVPVAGDSAALFVQFVAALAVHHEDLAARHCTRIPDTILELLDAILLSQLGVRSLSQRECRHRERIARLVERELRNPALDIPYIARGVGLSARHVHRLFAGDALPLMQWVQELRLKNCYLELSQSATRPIGEVALSWGFNDQAHFSRVFRHRFGMAPSALRASRGKRRP